MKLEHFGMAEPGDCRVVFMADAEELNRAVEAEKAAGNAVGYSHKSVDTAQTALFFQNTAQLPVCHSPTP